jgi:hypothetical protein
MYYKLDNPYYKLNDNEVAIIKDISKITFTDYEIEGGLIPADTLMVVIEDLLTEYHRKEEELEDLHNEISENYELKKVDLYSEHGISERDFI